MSAWGRKAAPVLVQAAGICLLIAGILMLLGPGWAVLSAGITAVVVPEIRAAGGKDRGGARDE